MRGQCWLISLRGIPANLGHIDARDCDAVGAGPSDYSPLAISIKLTDAGFPGFAQLVSPTMDSNNQMFRLEIDLSIHFVPPMDEHGPGIRLTQSFELPFPPFDRLSLTGNAFNPYSPSPEGFPLKGVTWDVDRRVFLANIVLDCHDHPIALISDELRTWIESGWRLGSLSAAYEQADTDDEPTGQDDLNLESVDDGEELEERLQGMRPRSRPPDFNKLLRAFAREMTVIGNNLQTAYAIDRTQMFFSQAELRGDPSPSKQAYSRALAEFDGMSNEERFQWQERVAGRHSRLDRIVSNS